MATVFLTMHQYWEGTSAMDKRSMVLHKAWFTFITYRNQDYFQYLKKQVGIAYAKRQLQQKCRAHLQDGLTSGFPFLLASPNLLKIIKRTVKLHRVG